MEDFHLEGMCMHRRSLLQLGSAAALTFGGARLWAQSPSQVGPDARFLLVFLRGGYDALSLLVPSGGFYKEVRPNIGVPWAAPGSGAAVGNGPALTAPSTTTATTTATPAAPSPTATPLNADWALHPALQGSVLPLARAGQAVFVPFAGTHDTSRSHFETQDSIELGQGHEGTAARDFSSGFLNRLAQQLGARQSIAFTEQLPLSLRGAAEVANVSLKAVPRAGAALQEPLIAMYRGTPLQDRVSEAFGVRNEVAREMNAMNAMTAMNGEMEAANRGAISSRGFELEARRMARLMRERYALAFVDVGGWDTHVNQGAATGALATRLEELGRGLAGFAQEIGPAVWKKTVVVVLSEFGRTTRENGNRGTDHGHGSVHWVLGGGLAGQAGPVAGDQVAVAQRTLFQNRDLPVLNEYRSVLGGLLGRQFGLSDAALRSVFPGAAARDLGLL